MSTTASTSVSDGAPTPSRARGRRLRLGLGREDRPFLILLAVAAVIRAATMPLYFPAVMTSMDSPRFARVNPEPIFGDQWQPAGYAAVLKALRVVTDEVWFTIAVQHLMGLVIGVVVYLVARRLGASPVPATAAAAAALLSGDVLYIEHWFMSDVLFLHVIILTLASAVFGLVPRVDRRWLLAAGCFGAAATLTRVVGFVAIPVVIVFAAVWVGGPWRQRLRTTGAVVAGAALIFGGYFLAYAIKDGPHSGLTAMGGWQLYARVAPFADCSRFEPPKGTRALCEDTDPAKRPGVFYYTWEPSSIARQAYPDQNPETSAIVGRFAQQAILHQPGDYALAVGTDLLRYLEPSAGIQRGYSGQPRELNSFGWRNADVERVVTNGLEPKYDGTRVHAPGARTLGVYQQLFRVDRLALVTALILAIFGALLLRGPIRMGVLLFGLMSLALYVAPTMTLSYDFRYGIPPGILLWTSGVLATAGLLQRRSRKPAPAPAA
ncbi:glycosyltransferase family 39 protein [Solirubrobacter sp. CPCC 204708]|uniref:Glycosyltransferase family 39 protein n=1 Tax=Solirubrobacter deserti TaxID=2282478 RepID=A0ABT4RN60_9ACTN|nr:glycosyltransferase family 39 protein [Solirubrobacter deserti]MBE2317425.1 glycosyltransferase family 39 protein [Solirubrobacter deserti]MDA0140007.1 glycosyltransferase family 39 protein [Solirubrobacter deserti]